LRSRPLPRPLLIAAALLTAVPVLWACAPYLPNWLLGSEETFFEGFRGKLATELDRLQPPYLRPPFEAVPSQDGHDAEVLAAERKDLAEAMERHGTWTILRVQVMDKVVRLREDLARVRAEREQVRLSGTKPGRPAPPSNLTVPQPLLPEFADYLEGAIAWHDHRSDDAIRAWERLLRRPEDERRFRSTWAAYMIGRASIPGEWDRAVKSFQLTRDLAARGFEDTLGLAAASFGWEAYVETARDRYAQALILYAQQLRTGDPGALVSVRLTCAELLHKPEALIRVAKNPEARAIFTAWLVSRDPEGRQAWEKALAAADVRDVAGADRLAWAAYLSGDFAAAAAWLDRAQEQSAIAKWVRARLLLRDGKLDEARDLLAEAARDLPDLGMTMDDAMQVVYETGEVLAAPQRALGEEAVVRVTQRDYTGALDRFLRAGYWMDAAYLAEQVLTLDELKAYVDATWPAELAAKYEPPKDQEEWDGVLVGGYASAEPERIARDLRNLLGRRLAREDRRRDALDYVLPERRPALERLAGHIEAGRDRKRPAAERGRELFQAACLTRHQGMELTGTEVEPDWALVEGSYQVETWTFGSRDTRRKNRILQETPDETARVKRNRVRPWRRFHYRYRAADLAWEAAGLLPSGDEKAGMLATAGRWIEHENPQAADRFYKQLVRCCGTTDLGREADELRWFPETDACPVTDPSR
jgi:tetratricopeptide (TPR) repeat protein